MFKLVNPKQFARILKRREKLKNRKKPKVQSRSLLATSRKRSNGRFLSAAEIEALTRLNRFKDNEILPPTGQETDQDKIVLERVEKELLSKKVKAEKGQAEVDDGGNGSMYCEEGEESGGDHQQPDQGAHSTLSDQ